MTRGTPKNAAEMRLRQQAIGAGLRQIFEDVVNEAVPEEFLDILRTADSASPTDGARSAREDGAE